MHAMWQLLVAGVSIAAGILATSPPAGQPVVISEPIPYFIAGGRGITGFSATDPELARWALAAWERASDTALRFQAAQESSALLRVYWAEPKEDQYGEMTPVMVGNRIGAAVYIRPDMTSLGPDIAEAAARDPLLRETVVYLTCVHEIGHALGLTHTRDYRDVMYFFGYGGDIPNFFRRYRTALGSRADIARLSGLSDGDVMKLKAVYHAGVPDR